MSSSTIDTGGSPAAVRFYRRHWFFLASWLLLTPLGLLILWTGPIYQSRKGVVSTMRRRDKIVFSIIGVLWLLFSLAKLGGGAGATEIPTCDASDATDLVMSAVKNSPAGRQTGLEILNLKNIQEAGWSNAAQIRTCQAMAFTNGGTRQIAYRLTWLDRSKGLLGVEVQ